MTQPINCQPLDNELPSHYADRLGRLYAGTVTTQHKKDNGQFFTPAAIAHFMGGLVKQSKNKLKILDPGCGTAILSSSLIEILVQKNETLKEVELVVYETDKDILPFTQWTLNYLKKWLQINHVEFKATLDTNDFVLENKDCFEQSNTLFYEPKNAIYDIVISNPPYFKIGKEDKSEVLYLGDTANKDLYIDKKTLKELGIAIDEHSKLPDVILYDKKRKWPYLIEAVTSHGPVSPKRVIELEELLKDCKAGKVYVSAFPDFAEFKKHSTNIAWKTEVWVVDFPEHMIHFNGDRFMGPR